MENDYQKETHRYNKCVEDLIEDAEIEAELEAESKIRSKNTRLFLISIVGIGLLFIIYLGLNIPFEEQKNSVIEDTQATRSLAEAKPIPFLRPVESTKILGRTKNKEADVPTIKRVFESPKSLLKTKKENSALKNRKKSENFDIAKLQIKTKPSNEKKSVPRKKIKTLVKKVAIKVRSKSDSKIGRKPTPRKPKIITTQKGFFVQVGVFSQKSNAYKLIKLLKEKGLNPAIKNRITKRLVNTVFVGHYKDKKSTTEHFEELRQAGFNPSLKEQSKNNYTFILGEFKTESQADMLRNKLSLKGFLSGMKKSKKETTNYVVQLGAFQTKDEARSKQTKMKKLGYKKTFIRTIS